jgi:hypothetical protein
MHVIITRQILTRFPEPYDVLWQGGLILWVVARSRGNDALKKGLT